MLIAQGHLEVAAQVAGFLDQMPPVGTEKEQLAVALLQRSCESRIRDQPAETR
jgi:hypothetical protein